MRSFIVACIFVALAGAGVQGQDFSNDAAIAIPTYGPATPYPSVISVSGAEACLYGVTVTLNAIEHGFPDDLDILLVGPTGANVLLMSDCGAGVHISGVTLTFDDAAPTHLPDGTAIATGTYRPTNYGSSDPFASQAPSGPYGASFAGFVGTDPNGEWRLYVVDDYSGDGGRIVGGWTLHLDARPCGTGACCVGAECSLQTAEACAAAEGVFLGIGTDCGEGTCEGACCQEGGGCLDGSQESCQTSGGLFAGLGTACDGYACPQLGDQCLTAFGIDRLPYSAVGNTCNFVNDYDSGYVAGACPFYGSTAKDVVYRFDCEADTVVEISLCNDGTDYDTKLYVYEDEAVNPPLACMDDVCETPLVTSSVVSRLSDVSLAAGHTYYIVVDGYLTDCGNYQLSVRQYGACCEGTECSIKTREACTDLQGVYVGEDSECELDTCTPRGACCVGTECIVKTAASCDSLQGVYIGDDSECAADTCMPRGACCVGPECSTQTEAGCGALAGSYAGDGTDCISSPCAPPCLARGDSNCDGAVNTFDIDAFVLSLTAAQTWLATYGCDYGCANDVNCDGAVNTFDIDPFVLCLTSGCPACD